MQDFINSELGEVWSIVSKTTDEKAIVRRRGQYERGAEPFKTLKEYLGIEDEQALFLTVDVQKNVFLVGVKGMATWWYLGTGQLRAGRYMGRDR